MHEQVREEHGSIDESCDLWTWPTAWSTVPTSANTRGGELESADGEGMVPSQVLAWLGVVQRNPWSEGSSYEASSDKGSTIGNRVEQLEQQVARSLQEARGKPQYSRQVSVARYGVQPRRMDSLESYVC